MRRSFKGYGTQNEYALPTSAPSALKTQANRPQCDVLIASFDAHDLRTTGLDLLTLLWTHSISAELAVDARSPEDLLSKYRDDRHSWIVIIKQDQMLKVKSTSRKDQDIDIPTTQLLSWLRSELRDRDHREHTADRTKALQRHPSAADTGGISADHEQVVRVLVAQTKSKKVNRTNIVEQAQQRAAALVHSFLDGPIAAIETTDAVMEMLKETRLSDPESWRRVTQSVGTAERRYVGEIGEMLRGLAEANRGVTRNAFVYNFRTGGCFYYDLGA